MYYKLLIQLQKVLVRLNRVPVCLFLSRVYYRIGVFLYAVGISICSSSIIAVYVRNSYVTGEWVPWEGDVDFTVIIDDETPARESITLKRFWLRHKILTLIFPFIRHIDLMTEREFICRNNQDQPSLYYMVDRTRRVLGREFQAAKPTLRYSLYSFRIHDWISFTAWLDDCRRHRPLSLRAAVKFFRKFMPLFPESTPWREKLAAHMALHQSFHQEKADYQFGLRGFYYVNSLLSFASAEMAAEGARDGRPRFTRVVIPEKVPEALFDKSLAAAEHLKPFSSAISGILLDTGSLCARGPRIWLIMQDSVAEARWLEVVDIALKHFSQMVPEAPLQVFNRTALELFLNTQRYWMLEQSHLLAHARIVQGENCLQSMRRFSDSGIYAMLKPNLIVKRFALRECVFNSSVSSLQSLVFDILQLKILVEDGLIVTTRREVAEICDAQDKPQEFGILRKIAEHGSEDIPPDQTYALLASITDQLQKRIGS